MNNKGLRYYDFVIKEKLSSGEIRELIDNFFGGFKNDNN